jgi:ribonucleoside-diphosphate reductase alpha chain
MSARERIPNRRASVSFAFELNGLRFWATFSRFPDGRLAELFLSNHKSNSAADANARDSAIVASLALQHGVPLETIRRALLRDSHESPSTPLGAALDIIADGESWR